MFDDCSLYGRLVRFYGEEPFGLIRCDVQDKYCAKDQIMVFCAETYVETRMAVAFEALLIVELRYVICDGRAIIQYGRRLPSSSNPDAGVAWGKSPVWRLPVSNPCDPYPATSGQIITYYQALQPLD